MHSRQNKRSAPPRMYLKNNIRSKVELTVSNCNITRKAIFEKRHFSGVVEVLSRHTQNR